MKSSTKDTYSREDTYNRAAFEKAMKEKYKTSMVRYDKGDNVGHYCDTVVDKEWATWVLATRAEWERVGEDQNTPKLQPVAKRTDIDDAVVAKVRDALHTLCSSYIQDGGGIAMVAANDGAHPRIRDAWEVIGNWLESTPAADARIDLLAVKALMDAERLAAPRIEPMDADWPLPSVVNIHGAKLGKYKAPKKAIRKEVKRELKRLKKRGKLRGPRGYPGMQGPMGLRGTDGDAGVSCPMCTATTSA